MHLSTPADPQTQTSTALCPHQPGRNTRSTCHSPAPRSGRCVWPSHCAHNPLCSSSRGDTGNHIRRPGWSKWCHWHSCARPCHIRQYLQATEQHGVTRNSLAPNSYDQASCLPTCFTQTCFPYMPTTHWVIRGVHRKTLQILILRKNKLVQNTTF